MVFMTVVRSFQWRFGRVVDSQISKNVFLLIWAWINDKRQECTNEIKRQETVGVQMRSTGFQSISLI